MRRFLHDCAGALSLVNLPLVPPATSQLIGPGTVYGELIDVAQAQVAGDVLNVSLCGGFALADSIKCGFSVVVTARRGARATALQVSRRLAQRVWDERRRFLSTLTPLPPAVALAHEAVQDPEPPPRLVQARHRGADEAAEQRVRLEGFGFQLGVERHAD